MYGGRTEMNILLEFRAIIITIFLLACRTSIVFSEQCEILSSPSGQIVHSEYTNRLDKCWMIRLPRDTQARVNLERFTSETEDCAYVNVKISIPDSIQGKTYCPGRGGWGTFMAFQDFKIRFIITHPYSSKRATFSLKYQSESRICAQSNSFVCSPGVCIERNQVCDGVKDCDSESDEWGCETGIYAARGVLDSRKKAIQWMINKRTLTSGWQENTHRAVISLFLGTNGNFTESDIEKELMVKQLEVQTLVALLRNETDEISVHQLSMFVSAMLVTCQNPRNFYGFDMVALLKNKAQESPLASIPVAYLALCNAKESLQKNATMELNSILTSDSEYPFLLDIQAVSAMALSCLNDGILEEANSSEMQQGLVEIIDKFKELQREDGSFGNIYTTAVITQALLSCGQEHSQDWKVKSAVTHLIKHLNSSSVDFLSTYLTLPILNGKSLSDIRNINCSGDLRYTIYDPVTDAENKLGPKMRIQYSLYIGDQKDIIHTISLRVPENITAYEIMQLAETADSKYKFKWKQMKSKIYVYEIAGITNDVEDGQFWLFYVGKDSKSLRHSLKSLDAAILQNEEHMVMWFKKAQIFANESRNMTQTLS